VFPPGARTSMFGACVAALILQCGTSTATFVTEYFSPRVGLGCRSLGYTLYGSVSVLILFFTIISTILARLSETRTNESAELKSIPGFIAITLRRLCLVLAFVNTAGLIAMSCFQFSRFIDTCYCNASVIGDGTNSYIVQIHYPWTTTIIHSRVAAIAAAGGCMAIYMFFLWFASALPGRVEDI
jgi:hypothetical protein